MDREVILKQSRKFFAENHKRNRFIPGETYIPASGKFLDSEDLSYLVDSCLDMWLTNGRYTHAFEKELSKWFKRDVPALFVNSGSSANLVAITSLGLTKGDEVLTAAASFPTTVNPILQNGATPVFVDIDPNTLNVTLESLKEAKSPRTKAVVLAHTLGNPFRVDEISKWCEKEGLYLIEDCCDAFGATVDGKPVGSFGDYATLSFYPAHHITTGEGGAILTDSGFRRRVSERFRDWGRDCWCEPGKDNTCKMRFNWKISNLPPCYDHKYIYRSIGYNLKATDMQAAVGLSQLNKVEYFILKRRKNWKLLNEAISKSNLLGDFLTPIQPTMNSNPSWFGFAMYCDKKIDRTKLLQFLEEKRIGTRLLFAGNITKQPAYKNSHYVISGDLKATDHAMEKAFWIGVHPSIGREKILYMIKTLEQGIKLQL